MFRRSLVWFLAASFAVLLIVLGYAALGLRDEEVMQEARQALASGRPQRAITLVDRALVSLGPNTDPELRREMLRVRCDAHIATNNARAVLRDLVELRKLDPEDQDLALLELRWTLQAGLVDEGIALSERMAAASPDDPNVRELCGDAAQLAYQEKIRELVVLAGDTLPETLRPTAFVSLRRWLYGPRNAASTAAALRRFEEILQEHAPETFARSDWRDTAIVIRELIDESQGHFKAALELGGLPVAAYRGLTYALEQGGRTDDLTWHAELYRRNYDHLYTTDAAADLAELHLAAGRNRLAIRVEEEFVDRDEAAKRAIEGGFSERLPDILLASARARFRLDPPDATGLSALNAFCVRFQDESGISLGAEALWIAGLSAYANDTWRDVASNLRTARDRLRQRPATPRNISRQTELTSVMLAFAESRQWPLQSLNNLTRELVKLQPDDAEALVDNAERHLREGSLEGAIQQLRRARRIADNNESIRRLLANVEDRRLGVDGRSGADRALQRCIDTGNTIPSDLSPTLLPLVAERALELGEAELALQIAEQAARSDPAWLWPRELIVNALFALERNESAAENLRQLLAIRPDDPEALDLSRSLRKRSGQGIDDLLHDLLVVDRTDTEVAETLFAQAKKRGRDEFLRHLAIGAARTAFDDPRALLLLGQNQMDLGDYEQAQRTLQSATETAAEDDLTFREAILKLTIATAHLGATPDLTPTLLSCLDVHRTNTAGLTALAKELTELNQFAAAYVVVERVLADAVHDSERNGEHFLLAAELTLRLGTADRTEDHLRAALAFPETEGRAQVLYTLLLWEQGRDAEAANAWIDVKIDDVSSACHAVRIGQRDRAADWVRSARDVDPLDPCLVALQARIAPLEFPAPQHPAMALAKEFPDELLDLLTFVDNPLFAKPAVDRAQELIKRTENPFVQLLLARALNRLQRPDLAKPLLLTFLADPAIPQKPDVLEELLISLEQLPNDKELRQLLWAHCLQGGYLQSSLLTRRVVDLVLLPFREGSAEAGLDSLEFFANIWIFEPEKTGAGLDEVRLLASAGMQKEALSLCQKIDVPAEQQRAYLNQLLALYGWHLDQPDLPESERDDLTTRADALAELVLQKQGPYGGAVHYLLDRAEARFGPMENWPDPRERRRARNLLSQHLQLVRLEGVENVDLTLRSLERLAHLDGARKAIEKIDGILRADPTLTELWLLRARWQIEDGHLDEALAGLRWTYDFLPTHPMMLDIVEIALRSGRATDADREIALEALDERVRKTVKGRTVAGLLALRAGQLDEAIAAFESPDEGSDAEQLYFLALAYLRSGRPADARATLERLLEDHPSSSRSEYAAHFARRCGD